MISLGGFLGWHLRGLDPAVWHALRLFQELFRDGDLSIELNGLRSRWDRKPR